MDDDERRREAALADENPRSPGPDANNTQPPDSGSVPGVTPPADRDVPTSPVDPPTVSADETDPIRELDTGSDEVVDSAREERPQISPRSPADGAGALAEESPPDPDPDPNADAAPHGHGRDTGHIAEPVVGGDSPATTAATTAPTAPAPPADEPEWAEAIGEAVSRLPTLDAPRTAAVASQSTANGDGFATRRPLPRILAVANQKGGVGKTTTAVNLGAGLAELGYRVLVVDLDPQGNASTGLGINARSLSCSVYDVLLSETPLDDCIEPTAVRNLFVAPATIDLAGAEIELVSSFSRELKLRRALQQLGDDYDYTLIDCPPSLGLLTVNGLAAASEVLVPIQCEYYALEGLGQLLRNVQLVQSNLNPRLELSAIVLTMFDARTRLADQVATEVRAHFGPKVCRNIIPRTVRLSEAPSFGQPIIVFDSSSRGALAYRELAKEVSGGTPQRIG